ncbi:hypothetical protein FKP32DRAFT_1672952 [Trametes sanguinea]|nr:hypothetical protein FKP32DRAFT_1672952 [Trametes sanguinea]
MPIYTTLLLFSLLTQIVHAFVPAYPSNITIAPGAEQRTILRTYWPPAGSFATDTIELVLRSDNFTGSNIGALVHITDDVAATAASGTKTPWIALVSCDQNITNSSDTNIFTRAAQLGAKAASLLDPSKFERTLDIYISEAITTSLILNSTFIHIDSARYGSFDADALTSSYDAVMSWNQHAPTGPYIIATLVLTTPSTTGPTPDMSATVSLPEGTLAASSTVTGGNEATTSSSHISGATRWKPNG